MTKDWRNPPTDDETLWEWLLDDVDPITYAATLRHRGILTAPEGAKWYFDQPVWDRVRDLVADNGMTLLDLQHSLERTLERSGGMPRGLSARTLALVRHLQSLTPERSLSMLPVCEQALDAANVGAFDRVLEMTPYANVAEATVEHVLYSFELDPECFAHLDK